MIITYIIGRDGAGRVAGDKLELHVDVYEEEFIFGAEAGAGGFVEGEGEEAAAVEDFGTAVAPRDLEVLVEVATTVTGGKGGYYD